MSERIYPLIRTASVDSVFESNAKAVAALEGSDATQEDKEAMDDLKDSVEEDLDYIRDIQEELLDYLTEKGLDVWKYLKRNG